MVAFSIFRFYEKKKSTKFFVSFYFWAFQLPYVLWYSSLYNDVTTIVHGHILCLSILPNQCPSTMSTLTRAFIREKLSNWYLVIKDGDFENKCFIICDMYTKWVFFYNFQVRYFNYILGFLQMINYSRIAGIYLNILGKIIIFHSYIMMKKKFVSAKYCWIFARISYNCWFVLSQ